MANLGLLEFDPAPLGRVGVRQGLDNLDHAPAGGHALIGQLMKCRRGGFACCRDFLKHAEVVLRLPVCSRRGRGRYRRRGIGRRLLVRALEDAAGHGAVKVYLEVRRNNLAAQKLYEQFGFEVTGVRPRYYVDTQEDALLMTLEPLTRIHSKDTQDTQDSI